MIPPSFPRRAAHVVLRTYQLTLSALAGRQCRHLPTCSTYMDEAIQRYGLWPGGWMGVARVCRCHPWGTSGFDPVPDTPATGARWYLPWRYGVWRLAKQPEAPCQGEGPVNGVFQPHSDGPS